MKNLNNKVAVVIGGNSGIGYASAKKLNNEGAQVVITGRDEDKVNEAAKELGVIGIVADVSDLHATDTLVEKVKKDFGTVDVLFVNAGVFKPEPLGHISESSFDYTMDINFKGAVFTVEKFLPILKDGASIINLASINAYTGMPNTAIYAASKAAMNSYTRTASSELAPRKIRINSINPGPVETSIFSKTGLPEEALNGMATTVLNKIPLGRFGQPEDIANLVIFLASDDSSFMTGSEINIDGGININRVV